MAGRRKKPTFKKEWTPEDEVALFNAIAKYKPVGVHRHVMMIMVMQELDEHYDDGCPFSSESIWEHLNEYYDMEALDASQPDIFPDEYVTFNLPKDFVKSTEGKPSPSASTAKKAHPTPATGRATRKGKAAAEAETPTLRRKRHASPALSSSETKRRR